ncbi:M20 family metallopeptidase [Geomicrobium sp. JCM 19038]|uniref:M20 metallopeptidase family protein n=1 Tax=Geomicrobium sp. JCM 19038 TaxID=1460635 RepID=UPI00045F2867|nr:amidohydrolase [Geomicrobium sp. JCM 19038]GAK06323.1 p-aminobenzoyl-glutamate hydrolase subunit A [Geomicrobium sp. JCM 19038]
MQDKLFQLLDRHFDEMVEIRRHLHENPEVSFHETNTAKYIADYHKKLGNEVQEHVGGNGVVAKISGKNPGPVVALRADFDALPIQDQKDVPYKSKVDGVMHACGHDGHTATLLVLAKALRQVEDELHGTVVFLHQHAEELSPGGAAPMIKDGALDGVDVVFGTHLWSQDPLGTVQHCSGPFMASADHFTIKVNGKGGHGALPHTTKDAVVIGSQIVNNIQTIVARRVNPLYSAVVSIGKFIADNPYNVIADSVEMVGTVRTFQEDVRNQIEQDIFEIAENTAKAYGATVEYDYGRGYPPVFNHAVETNYIAKIASGITDVNGVHEREPVLASEDFSYYLQKTKGSFFFTGAAFMDGRNNAPHHHPLFDFDERAMLVAAKTLAKAAIDYYKES